MGNLLQAKNTEFKTSASKFIGFKSKELDSTVEALEKYQNSPSQTHLSDLLAALISWFKKNPKEIKPENRGSKARELLQEMMTDARERNLTLDFRTADWQPSAITLIASVIDELNKCKDFVCSDAAQFSGDINPSISKQSQDEILEKAKKKGQGTGLAEIPRHDLDPGDWNPVSIKSAYERVYNQQAGECTSFGKAAAHLLSNGSMAPFMPRIEIVAFKEKQQRPRYNPDGSPLMIRRPGVEEPVHALTNIIIAHVFCVVGRHGLCAPGNKMPEPNTWNPEARIVDCWLGSLGYECEFSVATYPKPGYFTNLELVMDSYQGPNAIY